MDVHLKDVGAWPNGRSLLRLAFGFMLGLLLVALTSAILGVIGHVQWVRTGTGNLAEAALALIGYLALSCREELVFRGYPLRRLESRYGLWMAQLIIVVVFMVEHVAGGWAWGPAMVGAGVGDLLFGMAAIATRGLAVPIGILVSGCAAVVVKPRMAFGSRWWRMVSKHGLTPRDGSAMSR